jgi:hypothetical protein
MDLLLAFSSCPFLYASPFPNPALYLCTFSGRASSRILKASRQKTQNMFYPSSFDPIVGFPPTQASPFSPVPFAGFRKDKHSFIEFIIAKSFLSEPVFVVFIRCSSNSFVFSSQVFPFPSPFHS